MKLTSIPTSIATTDQRPAARDRGIGHARLAAPRRRSLAISAVLTVAVVTAALSGCGREPKPSATPPAVASSVATDFAAMMRQRVTGDAMMAHLTKLQEI